MKIEDHGGNIHKYDHPVLDFSANLNPLGTPVSIKHALIENIDKYEAYPDPDNVELKLAIGSRHCIEPDRIVCGNGAADIIFRIPLALKPKRALIIAPTFSEYAESLYTSGSDVSYYILKEDDEFFLNINEDIINILQAEPFDIVFICNPNNPTGLTIERNSMLVLLEACQLSGARLIVDECFMDFVHDEKTYSVLPDIHRFPNLIVLKSFTKIFAMAGIRLGYAICGSIEDCEDINGCLQTWPVSTVASVCGIAALSESDFVTRSIDYVAEEKLKLITALDELGFRTFDSKSNYIFFKSPVKLDDSLLENDILIRNCSNYVGLANGFYRIAIRTENENSKLINTLKEIMCKQ